MEAPSDNESRANALADLICDGAGWIHRRKDSIRFLDRQTIRRQSTVDLVVDDLPVAGVFYEAPVFFLPKRPEWLMGFDFVDGAGASLSLPNRLENAAASSEGLKAVARRVLGNQLGKTSEAAIDALDALLDGIAMGDMPKAEQLAEDFKTCDPQTHLRGDDRAALVELQQTLCGNATFSWALQMLASASIVMARLPKDGPRHRIVKLSYLEPVNDFDAPTGLAKESALGWAEYPLLVDIYFAGGLTYHVEIEAPPGTQISYAGVNVEDAVRGELIREPVLEDWRARVHLYLPDARRHRDGVCAVLLTVQRPGFVTGAFYSAVLVLATLIACLALAEQLLNAGAEVAVALLIGLPGLVATYVAQAGQHALTTRLLYGARRMLGWSALAAFAATFAFVAVAACDDPALLRLLWLPAVLRALWSAVALGRTWQRSTPPLHRGRLRRRLKAAWDGFKRAG